VISTLIANPILFELYDVSSVKDIVLGAAACGESLSQKIHELQPQWRVLVGYGRISYCAFRGLNERAD
jgi:hypothetical protein